MPSHSSTSRLAQLLRLPLLLAAACLVLAAPAHSAPAHSAPAHTADSHAANSQAEQAESTAAPATPFSVEVHGDGERPVFLLPGLGSPGAVWAETTERLVAAGYTAHVFTLAGFAGQPPIAVDSLPQFLPRVHAALIEKARRLDSKPALIGHSLGAVLSLWLAAAQPDLFGPVVAVDGVPFLPALTRPGTTAEQARAQADAMHAMISAMTPEAYDRQTAFTLSTMVTDPAEARRIAEISRGSDPATIAAAMRDLMTRDLRREISAIKSPVLMLGAGAPATTEQAAAELGRRYADQVAAIPEHRVVMIEDARHFIMVDQPERFLELALDHLNGSR